MDRTMARETNRAGCLAKGVAYGGPGEHFCQNCNRLRLTADGCLRPCLLWDNEINLREPLRNGQSLLPLILSAVETKPQGHGLIQQQYPESRRMAQIGG